MPKVSVIITAYNQASYIGEALLSVINQSYSDWECIIVDDGSTDDTLKFCERLADNDSRFRIVTQMNSGVAAARNKGFSLSKGEFIQFLDGDDFIMPSKLEVQLKHMIANPQYGVSYTNHRHFWQTTGSLAQYTFEILEE